MTSESRKSSQASARLPTIRLPFSRIMVESGAPTQSTGTKAIPDLIADLVDLRLTLTGLAIKQSPLDFAPATQVTTASAVVMFVANGTA